MTLTQGYFEDSLAEMKDVVQRRVCLALTRVPVGAPLDRKSPGGDQNPGQAWLRAVRPGARTGPVQCRCSVNIW